MADTSSSVKVMRAMVEAPHSCNSGSAVGLRGKRLPTSVSSYATAGIAGPPGPSVAPVLGTWLRVGVRLRPSPLGSWPVPQLHRRVTVPDGQRLAVRAERHAPHHVREASEGGPFLAGLHVPHLDRLIMT